MFNNVGKKIMGIATVLFILGLIYSFGNAILYINMGDGYWDFSWRPEYSVLSWKGIIYLIIGPILSLAASWMIYGFGKIVEKHEE